MIVILLILSHSVPYFFCKKKMFNSRILFFQEIQYDRSLMFMDLKYVVPTGIGMPLILDAVGTSVVNLNMSAYINEEAFKNHGEFKLLAKLYPR